MFNTKLSSQKRAKRNSVLLRFSLATLLGFAFLIPGPLAGCSRETNRGTESKDPITALSDQAIAWRQAERDYHRPKGRPLTAEEIALFAPYFSAELLQTTRIRLVGRIKEPSFVKDYRRAGGRVPINFRNAIGLALGDTILITKRLKRESDYAFYSTLFHELVHLVQYQILGPEEMLDRYVRLITLPGSDYASVPFEAQAFQLQRRFRHPSRPEFSVEEEVRRLFEVDKTSAAH